MFQTANTGDESEYVRLEETIAPAAMAAVADWIEHSRLKKPWRSTLTHSK